jgi:hypothetical protein
MVLTAATALWAAIRHAAANGAQQIQRQAVAGNATRAK